MNTDNKFIADHLESRTTSLCVRSTVDVMSWHGMLATEQDDSAIEQDDSAPAS